MGWGEVGMKERVAALGGSLNVEQRTDMSFRSRGLYKPAGSH